MYLNYKNALNEQIGKVECQKKFDEFTFKNCCKIHQL